MKPTARWSALFAVAVLIAGCGRGGLPEVLSGVTVLRYGPLTARPAALMNGRVSFANGCASLEDGDGLPVTGLWPPGTWLDATTGDLRIVVDGVPFAEGEELSMGGGEYADEAFVISLVGPIPVPCRGEHYWLLTDLVGT